MSIFGNIGNAIKKGVTDVGHFAGKAASNPFVQGGLGLLTGGLTVPILAGAAGGLLKPGGNIGQGLAGAGSGALAGGAGKLAGSVLGGGLSLGNVGSALGKIGGGLLSGAGAGSAGGGGGGLDLGTLLRGGLGAAGLLNASHLSDKSNEFANKAVGNVEGSYNARAPLRAAGTAGLLNPSAGVPLATAEVRGNAGAGNPFFKKMGAAL